MATTLPIPLGDHLLRGVQDRSSAALHQQWAPWLPFVGVVGLALFLNAWGLSATGYGNTYYAAAVRSMTASWHNFFFAAFDPGGFISVDKPPVFLWIDALSARIFGYSSWSLLLPSAVAGAASVALVWLIVRRYFGVFAATIAALVLALTPIAVAVDRLNLPEPFYVLALVGAAGAVLRSLESRRWWAWAATAGVLVGIAFNTKMLAAWIPGPALALAIVVGVTAPWQRLPREWAMRLAVLAGATFIVSASWLLVVDAWPASDRPYVGGSTGNTVSDLVLGYNGFGRVEGEGIGGGRGGPVAGFTFGNGNGGPTPPNNGGFTQRTPFGRGGGFGAVPFGGQTNPGQGGGNGNTTPFSGGTGGNGVGAGGARGAGGIIAGEPGLFRMLDDANGGQIGWLLPFALGAGVLALWRWRADALKRAAIVLFLGWVLLFGGIFSFAEGIYHSYYTAALAPGIAVLVGAGALALVELVRQHRAWLLALAAIAGVTVWVQLTLADRFPDFFAWVPPLMVVAVVAGVALVALGFWRRLPAAVGVAVVVGGLLLIPGAWSSYEAAHASLNTTLPQAGPRGGAAGFSFGSQAFDNGISQLAAWLEANSDPDARWDLAVSSAQNASTLIADYNLSVMAIGGFSGSDPSITPAQFADLVAQGEVRYVLTTGGFGGGRIGGLGGGGLFGLRGTNTPASLASTPGAASVMAAVESACTQVSDSSLPAQYSGSLYDCAGRAAALAGR